GGVWRGGQAGEDSLLASCYRRSMEEAGRLGARHIAFPGISTGVYRFPLERAARIAIATVSADLAKYSDLERAIFVTFDARATAAYQALLPII
ncbi:MAG: hypothetical protein EPN26_06125, partial [Rhodospirillales bacterium]